MYDYNYVNYPLINLLIGNEIAEIIHEVYTQIIYE